MKNTKLFIIIFFIIDSLNFRACEKEDIKKLLPFFKIYQEKYQLITTQEQMKSSDCKIEEKEKLEFFVLEINEFEENCELRLVFKPETRFFYGFAEISYEKEKPELKIIKSEEINELQNSKKKIDFLEQNPEKDCRKKLESELYYQKLIRIENKIKKDIFSIINNIGPKLILKGEIVISAYLSQNEENTKLALIDFFFKNVIKEYAENYERYKFIIISLIPKIKQEILELLQKEFEKVKNQMIKSLAEDFSHYSRTLAHKLIRYTTGLSEERINQIETIFNIFFPNAKKTVEKFVYDILIKTDSIFQNFLKNHFNFIPNFEKCIVNFGNKINNILYSFNTNMKKNLLKIFKQKWIDCSINGVVDRIVEDIVDKDLLKFPLYLENFESCHYIVSDDEKIIQKTYKLVFSINNRVCQIIALLNNNNDFIYNSNNGKKPFTIISCLKLTANDFKFKSKLNDINEDIDNIDNDFFLYSF